jgi:hypothetical protein
VVAVVLLVADDDAGWARDQKLLMLRGKVRRDVDQVATGFTGVEPLRLP